MVWFKAFYSKPKNDLVSHLFKKLKKIHIKHLKSNTLFLVKNKVILPTGTLGSYGSRVEWLVSGFISDGAVVMVFSSVFTLFSDATVSSSSASWSKDQAKQWFNQVYPVSSEKAFSKVQSFVYCLENLSGLNSL